MAGTYVSATGSRPDVNQRAVEEGEDRQTACSDSKQLVAVWVPQHDEVGAERLVQYTPSIPSDSNEVAANVRIDSTDHRPPNRLS